MSVRRMDHVGLVVEDLDAAIAFFTELGLSVEGQAETGGEWADKLLNLQGTRTRIAMIITADGSGRIELSVFDSPPLAGPAPHPPVNIAGIPRLTFVVDDLHDTLARLKPHGATLIGDISQFEDYCLYAYTRGPAGVIIGIVEEL